MNKNKIKFSRIEIRDLIKAWFAISVAFAIVISRGFSEFLYTSFIYVFVLAGLTVGVGFLLHELAHKVVAQRYGYIAEFRSFDAMLILAIAMSFLGFVFAAPGAVFIHGKINTERNGKISLAGPLTNLILAFIFLILLNFGLTTNIVKYGFMINSWLAIFNSIPIWNLDGIKIFRWNKLIWTFLILLGIWFLMLSF